MTFEQLETRLAALQQARRLKARRLELLRELIQTDQALADLAGPLQSASRDLHAALAAAAHRPQ